MSFPQASKPWQHQARILLERIEGRHHPRYGTGSMSGSVYDSAWVSLVKRKNGNEDEWVFPECFNFVYSSQLEDGGWTAYGDPVDRLMNTLASLLSLVLHRSSPLWPGSDLDIAERIQRAVTFLNAHLVTWDVLATDYVGFEVLIPAMLDALEKHNYTFTFPGRELLYSLNKKKLAGFIPELVYKHKTTVLHSLEGFIGKLDFDKMRHHVVDGHLMASPSSTAAYLMNCSEWDYDAEDYLRHVINTSRPFEEGSVPAAFPTTIFEVSWVLCTLLDNGFKKEDLSCYALDKLAGILENQLYEGGGVVGFAPGVDSDADDTAVSLLALEYLGRPVSPEKLIQTYETETHFKTYRLERNPSVTAHCNIFKALLNVKNPELYTTQIVKCANFILETWWMSDTGFSDKWHLSAFYPYMLISQGFLKLLDLCANGAFKDVRKSLLTYKMPIMLFQMCTRTLMQQAEDGSFGKRHSREETAYAIIALANLASLPFIIKSPIIQQIYSAISKGRQFIRNDGGLGAPYIVSKDYLWVEKVTYASNYLQNAYVLAAFQTPVPAYDFQGVLDNWISIPFKKVEGFTSFYAQLPLFKKMQKWEIQASLIEGYLFLPQLAKVKLSVFDRKGFNEDKYLEYIPFSWVGPNNADRTFTGPGLLYDLMIIALLNYQVDEYIEAVVGVEFKDELEGVLAVVEALFAENSAPNDDIDFRDIQNLTKTIETPSLFEKPLKSPVGSGFQKSSTGLGILPTPQTSPIKANSGVELSEASIKTLEKETAAATSANQKQPLASPALSDSSNYSDHGKDNDGDSIKTFSSRTTSPDVGHRTKEEETASTLGFSPRLLPVYEKLSYFVSTILNHPHIQKASQFDKNYLRMELHAYLRTQVGQGVRNERLRAQTDRRTFETPNSVYLKWARGAAGEHVSCHYAFAFLVCLLSHRLDGQECFPTEEQNYLAHASCMHLAAMCRMYNDLGSIPRDRDEGNLNSTNFPEFKANTGRPIKDMKASLLRIAEFERRRFEETMVELEELCKKDRKRVAQLVRFYTGTVDYYGQLYVLRDMTCRI